MSTRPRSITLIGWLFIAVGCFGILKDLLPLVTPGAAQAISDLRAQGLTELGPAWTSRLLAAIGGAALLHGLNWARWLLVAWMGIHVALSVLHSPWELLFHCVLFAPILYFFFRPKSTAYFRGTRAPPP